MSLDPPLKRIKLDDSHVDAHDVRARRTHFLDSLARSVSPPPTSSTSSGSSKQNRQFQTSQRSNGLAPSPAVKNDDRHHASNGSAGSEQNATIRSLRSPVQLTKIRGLQSSENVDTVSLHDILGDPLIKEAWIFNFCFDVDWLMRYFDPDTRDLVKVKLVHGSWRREDANKICIDDACSRRPNVDAIQAYLPDAFGTHHSKMFILFRHDDCAQVIIHTANMLAQDWTNMTQAVWRSPLLPLLIDASQEQEATIGGRFKADLNRYLKAYGNKLKPLIEQLQLHDFGDVKAAVVASVPAKFTTSSADDKVWGHEMLRRQLGRFRNKLEISAPTAHLVFQVSSIASLPSTWLEETLYKACGSSKFTTSIIFPTPSDVAMSLDGYAAGASIHTKAQKEVHLKQISAMKSQLCRWTTGIVRSAQAGRNLAAPHIKTYIRYANKPTISNSSPAIDWALVTSANLSTQAWGSTPRLAKGEKTKREALIHIQSFEIGVLILPEMFQETTKDAGRITMIPSFKSDIPDRALSQDQTLLGFRMSYDLPLTSYASDELPWSPQSSYEMPDRHGRSWEH